MELWALVISSLERVGVGGLVICIYWASKLEWIITNTGRFLAASDHEHKTRRDETR